MNPYNKTWQKEVQELTNGLVSVERAKEIRQHLQLINTTNLFTNEWDLLKSTWF